MNNRTFVVAALALGLVAAVLNYVYLSSAEAAGVVVLKVKPDVTLNAGSLPNPDAFDRVTIYGDLGQLRNLVVTESDFPNYIKMPLTQTLKPGDLLYLSSFSVQGDQGIRQELKPGERAVALTVPDEAKAAAYFVRPGDVVDLWGNLAGQALVLKERARVLAVGDTYRIADERAGDRTFRTITIVVPESDIPPLLTNLNAAAGSVTLVLVGPEDAKLQPKPALPAITSGATLNAGPARPAPNPKSMVMPPDPKAVPQAPAPAAAAPQR